MKTKLFSLLVVLLYTTCLKAYDFKSGDLCYTIIKDTGTYRVEITQAEFDSAHVAVLSIPETVIHEGITYTVSSIGEGVFKGFSFLTHITIPSSVTNIGESAFSGCTALTSIIIGNDTLSIERHDWRECH